MTKREAQIKLDETDFDERRLINKRKKLINEGKDPDAIEEEIKQKRKEKRRKQYERRKKIDQNDEENMDNQLDANKIENVEKCE